jgi:hypothetical protein
MNFDSFSVVFGDDRCSVYYDGVLFYEGGYVPHRKSLPQRHGYGVQYDYNFVRNGGANVRVYAGLYNRDKPYEGDWKAPTGANGVGKVFQEHADGSVNRDSVIYEGEFADGKFHGRGKQYRTDGSIVYEGDFVMGRFHGTGTLYWGDESVIYEGEFAGGQFHGLGRKYPDDGLCLFNHGTRYVGGWKPGVGAHGYGKQYQIYEDLDTQIYEGEWVDGERHGYGKQYDYDGRVRY